MERTTLLPLLALLMTGVQSCELQLPMTMPQLTDVSVETGDSPNTVVNVKFLTDSTAIKTTWWLERDGEREGEGERLPISDTTTGPITQQVISHRDGYTFRLTSESEAIRQSSFTTIFRSGCLTMLRSLVLNLQGNVTVTETEPMTITKSPDPEVRIQPYQSLDIEVESRSEYFGSLRYRFLSFRNHTGFYDRSIMGFSSRQSPLELSVLSTGSPPRPGRQRYQATGEIPSGLYDFVFLVNWAKGPGMRESNNVISYDSLYYIINYYTDDKTEPEFIVKDCNGLDQSKPPVENVGDTTVLRYKSGEMVCFSVITDGNPLPEHAVAEMSGPNNVVKVLDKHIGVPWAKTYDRETYVLPPLLRGESREYVLVLKSDRYIHRKLRIQSYVPMELDTLERIEVMQPGRITLRCRVKGNFELLGFYKTKYWDANWGSMGNSQEWEELKSFPARTETAARTYTYTMDMNQTLIDSIIDDYMAVFCAAKDSLQKKTEFFRFKFQRGRNYESDTWY